MAATSAPCCSTRDARGVRQVEDRVALGAKLDALVAAGQEAATPLPRGDRLVLPALSEGREDDEAGQVVGLAAQSVGDPGAHAGPAGDLRTGVHEHVGRVVVDRLGGHRSDQADLVDHRPDVREQCADLGPLLAKRLERVLRAETKQLLPLKLGELLAPGKAFRHRLAVHRGELRLRVEGLQMRRAARHRQPDHSPGFLRQRQRAEHATRWRGLEQRRTEQRGQGDGAETLGCLAEKGPACVRRKGIRPHHHSILE